MMRKFKLSASVMCANTLNLEKFAGGLIVSCQAKEGEPLYKPYIMGAMAQAAESGGAVGIRTDGPKIIKAVRENTRLPIIGSYKIWNKKTEVYVTPTFDSAEQIVKSGADIVGIDATPRPRGNNTGIAELIKRIKNELKVAVMADVSVLEEGCAAAEAGADFITTALAGYTSYSRQIPGIDFKLLEDLVKDLDVPIIAEGRIYTPGNAYRALELGAFAVIVGTAITNPKWITEKFVESMILAGPGK
jgi:putative N-acetylmannosamine-6-phosphate epimerase